MLRWISANFELFFLINCAWIISFLIAQIALKATEVGPKAFINRILHYMVVLGIIVMTASSVYVAFVRFPEITVEKKEKRLRIVYDASSVKSKFQIYFIAGKDLGKINVDGTGLEYAFEGKYPVREYYFSPDGKYVLVATTKDLHLISRKNGKSRLIDSVGIRQGQEEFKGSVSRVLWSPTSDAFFYRIARWTPYSAHDRCVVFHISNEKKDIIPDASCRVNEHVWGDRGENIYYSRYSNVGTNVYDVRIFRIPLTSLTQEHVADIQSNDPSLNRHDLEPFGVKLYFPDKKLSFDKNPVRRLKWMSEYGKRAGVTEHGFFYYQEPGEKQKTFFFVGKNPYTKLIPIRQLRWLPGEEYIIIEHDMFGILILDPKTEDVRQIIHGHSLGWYPY